MQISAMFCSKECMTAADCFHSLECQSEHVRVDDENDIFEVSRRMFFEALGIFGKIAKLQQFVEEFCEPKTIFDFDLAAMDAKQKQKALLRVVNSLQQNKLPEKMQPQMDKNVQLVQSITKNPKHRKFIDSFLRKQMEIAITNSFAISRKGECIGSAVFPLCSLLNHSCAPNLVRIAVDNKLAFVVSRPIEKNAQLFISYRENFFRTEKAERQKEILESYRFACKCEACSNDYEVIDRLFSDDLSFVEPPITIPTGAAAKAEFRSNCEYINKRIKFFPSSELCTLIERNGVLLESLAKVSPFIS